MHAGNFDNTFIQVAQSGYYTFRISVYIGVGVWAETKKTAYLTELTDVVTDLIAVPMFPKASTAKWLKSGPAYDRLVLVAQNGILRQLTDRSVRRVSFEENTFLTEKNGITRELESEFIQLAKLAGKQKERTLRFWADLDTKPSISQSNVMDEQCRYMHRQHMYHSYKAFETIDPAKATTMEVYTNPGRSPLHASLVSYTSICMGISSRWILIWRSAGYESLQAWFHDQPQMAMRMFRSTSAYSASMKRR